MKQTEATIQPTKSRVLLERLAANALQSTSIIIPETAQGRSQRFKVISIGPGVEFLEVGDTVLMGQYAGTTIELSGKEVILVNEEEVLAVIEE